MIEAHIHANIHTCMEDIPDKTHIYHTNEDKGESEY